MSATSPKVEDPQDWIYILQANNEWVRLAWNQGDTVEVREAALICADSNDSVTLAFSPTGWLRVQKHMPDEWQGAEIDLQVDE